MNDHSPKSAATKLCIFGVGTVIWLAVAIYLGYHAHNPASDCVGTFSCLTANEWGDFLAGVFAPIAFLWLVATVWIQSDELREQRKELALTRREFELNRSVMIEQADEAKKQAEYISTQTQLLSDEAQARKRQETLTSFTILVSRFIEYTRENADDSYYRSGDRGGQFLSPPLPIKMSDERYIDEQSDFINRSIKMTGPSIIPHKAEVFERSFIFLYSAEELIDKLPYHSRVSWKRSKIKSYIDACAEIIRNSPEFSDLKQHVESRDRRLRQGSDLFDFAFSND